MGQFWIIPNLERRARLARTFNHTGEDTALGDSERTRPGTTHRCNPGGSTPPNREEDGTDQPEKGTAPESEGEDGRIPVPKVIQETDDIPWGDGYGSSD